ncbi:glycosyltransferase [Porphyrobacter sp. YT40]|uniref:glycosyltransferase n=1 Tax=Porphyrobacter sp. YT40 TaxID=2547601 RepID=UPI0015E8D890|nr:glycosyltransferase [Porphyrobacter sp. YT40]
MNDKKPDTIALPGFADDARPKVLNLSADFPDPIDPAKTRVIRTLIDDGADEIDHAVISLNRISPSPAAAVRTVLTGHLGLTGVPFEHGLALGYAAPGRGLFHRTILERLGDRIASQIANMTRGPDLVAGHKLTIEGLAVRRIATRLQLPYAITVQGDTDTKILAVRPDLAPALRRVYHDARLVTFFAPWTHAAVEEKLGRRSGPVAIIPCPTELDEPLPPRPGGNGLISVFHLKSHTRKNLSAMAEALRLAASAGAPLTLAICGGGSPEDSAAAKASAGDAPGLVFEGSLAREAVAARMNAATGFVLPSRRETFGLVFIEALFAGLPIIYPAGQAVSGYFDDCPFAIAVPPGAPAALAAAMRTLAKEEQSLKQALAEWQGSPAAQRFTKWAIGEAYASALMAATGTATGACVS